MGPFAVQAAEKVMTCPQCGQRVQMKQTPGGYVCPLCGYRSGGSEHTEGRRRMAPTHSDVGRLLREAAAATTHPDQQRLVGAAEQARGEIITAAAQAREVDLARAVVEERLTPVRVHEHHTAATDWIGSVDTGAPEGAAREMVAQGSVWYSRLPQIVKQYPDELVQQALGMGRRLAGKYGSGADAAEQSFLDHIGLLHARDVSTGLVVVAASGLPQVGDQGAEEVGLQAPDTGEPAWLPGSVTTSERAPAMQELDHNTSGGTPDSGTWPSPMELPQQDVDAINGDSGTSRVASTQQRSSSMQTAKCPTCRGHGRVAVRREGASGVDQIDQLVDPHDNPKATPYPTDKAFAWEMPPDSGQAIAETEQQLAEREQLKGASRQRRAAAAAERAAEQVYLRVMGGQDDSGWAGSMGAGGVGPGEQDGGNPGNTYPGNIADPDPVYGFGGDNGNQPLKPYGADEADDVTNNPGMGYQPGQPIQNDLGGRVNQVGASRRASDGDPLIQQSLTFVRNRRALLDGQVS